MAAGHLNEHDLSAGPELANAVDHQHVRQRPALPGPGNDVADAALGHARIVFQKQGLHIVFADQAGLVRAHEIFGARLPAVGIGTVSFRGTVGSDDMASFRETLETFHVQSPWPCSLARMAATSSVMSMPTGHQVIQRPQPTQPLRPYCACQLPSLWVSH